MKNAQQLTFNQMECVFVCFVELTFVHTMYVVCLFNDFNVTVFKFNVNGELSITDENYYETRESKKERTMSIEMCFSSFSVNFFKHSTYSLFGSLVFVFISNRKIHSFSASLNCL